MGLKDFDYYSNVTATYPAREDYKKVFVYSKGKTIINGMARSQINDLVMKGYRDSKFTIEEDFDKDAYYAESRKYSEAVRAKEAEFKADLLDEHGLAGHPKANRAFDMAWERGHSAGYREVAQEFDDLADLMKP